MEFGSIFLAGSGPTEFLFLRTFQFNYAEGSNSPDVVLRGYVVVTFSKLLLSPYPRIGDPLRCLERVINSIANLPSTVEPFAN